MSNTYFRFKQFTVHQELAAMKVTTDACLFGAWVAADLHNEISSSAKVLDIGAGTGLLSLMIAQQTDAHIHAIEIDAAAAEQAQKNFDGSPWGNRLHITHGDAKNASFTNQYDVLVSNPPFYENELTGSNSQKNIAHHDEGLLLSELMSIIAGLQNEQGHFYLLLPYKRLEETEKLLSTNGLWIHRICKVKQSTEHGFFRVLIKGGKIQSALIGEEMAIRNKDQSYTTAFIQLLSPYYLYM